MTFRVVMVPLAVLLIGLGLLIGGRAQQVLIVCGTVLAGVGVVLVLAGA